MAGMAIAVPLLFYSRRTCEEFNVSKVIKVVQLTESFLIELILSLLKSGGLETRPPVPMNVNVIVSARMEQKVLSIY